MTPKANPRNETLHDGEWGDLTKAVFGITDRKKAKADMDELHKRLGIVGKEQDVTDDVPLNQRNDISRGIRLAADNPNIPTSIKRVLANFADRIDDEMVELPCDADGVPIHVGDTVYGCRSGMKMTISELRMTMGKWFISTSRGYLPCTTITHVRPDSWERIADELDEMVDAADSADDVCEKLADIADRIRKLADKDGKR